MREDDKFIYKDHTKIMLVERWAMFASYFIGWGMIMRAREPEGADLVLWLMYIAVNMYIFWFADKNKVGEWRQPKG